MKRLPTDLEILEEIYERYYAVFSSFSREDAKRNTKVFVPIDIETVASHFGVDPEIVFGRLYYHLDRKYGFTEPDGSKVSLFVLQAGTDRHCIRFPLLAAVLASLRSERSKHLLATWLSISAIAISLVSLVVSILKATQH